MEKEKIMEFFKANKEELRKRFSVSAVRTPFKTESRFVDKVYLVVENQHVSDNEPLLNWVSERLGIEKSQLEIAIVTYL